jgi:hypothetical protein
MLPAAFSKNPKRGLMHCSQKTILLFHAKLMNLFISMGWANSQHNGEDMKLPTAS